MAKKAIFMKKHRCFTIRTWNFAFTIITVRENVIFNNIHEKNEITLRSLVKVDMPLVEREG